MLDTIDAYDIELPAEAYRQVDKEVGIYNLPHPVTGNMISTLAFYIDKRLLNCNNGASNTDLPFQMNWGESYKMQLIMVLQALTSIHRAVMKFTKILQYGRNYEDFEEVFARYESVKLDASWLSSLAPILPWPEVSFDIHWSSALTPTAGWELRWREDLFRTWDLPDGINLLDGNNLDQMSIVDALRRIHPTAHDLQTTTCILAVPKGALSADDMLRTLLHADKINQLNFYTHAVQLASPTRAVVTAKVIHSAKNTDKELCQLWTMIAYERLNNNDVEIIYDNYYNDTIVHHGGDLHTLDDTSDHTEGVLTGWIPMWDIEVDPDFIGRAATIGGVAQTRQHGNLFMAFVGFINGSIGTVSDRNLLPVYDAATGEAPVEQLDILNEIADKWIDFHELEIETLHERYVEERGIIDYLWNPVGNSDITNESGLTISSYSKSNDVSKLESFIRYLEDMKTQAQAKGAKAEVETIEKQISSVGDHLGKTLDKERDNENLTDNETANVGGE
jgi:hypothetical protein